MNYKGFDKDLKCRGFQYEIGKSYEHDGKVKACQGGFHACEDPLDVFSYYTPNNSRYCEVEQSGEIDKPIDDSKVASGKIKIGAEIGLKGLLEAGIKFRMERCTYSGESVTNGCQAGAQATGYQAGAQATGYQAGAQATGYQAGAQATGDRAGAQATGYQAGAQATGDRAGAQATGDRAGAQATGYQAGAQATGINAAASAIGYESSAFADGKHAVACALGYNCKAGGTIGTTLVLVERGKYDGESYPLLDIKTARVDGDKIKANVWYALRNGEIVEAE